MRLARRSCGVSVLAVSVVFTFASLLGAGEAAAPPPEPTTTGNAEVSTGELELLLLPLTKAELIVEADGWLHLLQAKVKELSSANIALKKQNEQISKASTAQSAVEEAQKALESAEKALSEARTKADPDAIKHAEEIQKEAQEKLKEAQKAAEEARKADQEADADANVKAATDQALQKAEEKKLQEQQEEGEGAAKATDPAAPPDNAELPAVPAGAAADAAQLKAAAEAAEKKAEAEEAVKDALLADIERLRSERTGLRDRLNVVLDALETKGGEEEVKSYKTYIAAVSGITVDVSDTSAVWSTITGWLTSEDGGIRLALNVLKFILVLASFWVLSVILGRLVERAAKSAPRLSSLLRDFITKSVRRVVLIVGVVVSLSALGVNVGPILALIGAAGFVVGFALQGTLSNFASGLLILIYRPFDVGDVVDVAGVSGKVSSVTLVSTHLRTFDNKGLVVPNNEVWGGIITNATGTHQRRVDMTFGIGYADDIAKAQSVMEDILGNHELVLKDPEPVVKLHELADSSVNFVCRPWVRTGDYWTVYWDVTRAVKEQFDKNGVSIPFPQRDVHVYQETSSDSADKAK